MEILTSKTGIIILIMLAMMLAFIGAEAQTNIYVDIAASGSNNGSSWTNAYTNMNTALVDANAGTGEYHIYVAQGTYTATTATLLGNPNPTGSSLTSADNTFAIKRAGIKLYGGYATGGASRNVKTNVTTMDANFGYHGMVIAGVTGTTDSVVVEGFTIKNGSSTVTGSGNITVNTIAIFKGNGGGVNINTCTAPIAFRSTRFTSNSSPYGAGVYSYGSNPEFTNCIFDQNTTYTGPGGGMDVYNSNVIITQCVFAGNNATSYSLASGGGMYIGGSSNVTIFNSTFSNNIANNTGYSIQQDGGVLTIRNSIFWTTNATNNVTLSSYDITYSDVQQPSGTITGTGNINQNPLFTNSGNTAGADNRWATADDGLTLTTSSPARDVGNNADVPASITTDIADNGRIFPAVVDMGAYEGGVTASNSCSGTDLNLFSSNGGITYAWTGPNNFISSQQNPVINNANGTMGGVYTVTFTSSAGYTSSASTTVTFSTWYRDADADGFGNPSVTLSSCSQPAGYIATAGDCNDNNGAVHTPATAIISGTTSICHGASANLSITCTGTGPFSGTLSNGASFSGSTSPVTVSVSPIATTTYTIATFADNVNGCTPVTSGSAIITVTGIPPATIGDSRTGSGVVNLSASGSGTLNWYDDPTAGSLVNTGSSYSPNLSATQTFYVSNTDGGNTSYSIGKTSPTGPSTSGSIGLAFSVTSSATLNSVTVYPTSIGSGSIVWQSSLGATIASVPYNFSSGDVGQAKVVTLNFALTTNTNYRLIKSGSGNFRFETSGVFFPYTAAGSPVSITSTFGFPSFTYAYFYNWQISANSQCTSSRTPVTGTINTACPTISLEGNGNAIANGSTSASTADNTDFGQASAASNASVTFTIQNTGITPLNVGAISFSGANAGDFSVTSPPSSTVAASGSTSFVVTFNPSALGTRTATISIANNSCTDNPYTFALSGLGVTRVRHYTAP